MVKLTFILGAIAIGATATAISIPDTLATNQTVSKVGGSGEHIPAPIARYTARLCEHRGARTPSSRHLYKTWYY
ncbi:Uu.00g007790.m01.CDS01 [Anthostomella pinea]|uniref:Uu.00g007790.m01.CDS01 n=1 Tax=Anthostomella pinea TaxID=933095 RepID=A0AAI8VXZ5_9PEZI|nr:Uu.00g007790.m01.CDS01 [Anthostomella pinea]